MITQLELCWLAGLLEGEGYFGLRSDTGTAQVKLEMTDEDIILRALLLMQRITGKQHAITPVTRKDKKSHYQETYVIALYSKDAIKVMKAIVRIMGSRRRKKIWQTLNGHREKKIITKKGDISIIAKSIMPKVNVVPLRRRA